MTDEKMIEEMAVICCGGKIDCTQCFEEYKNVMGIKIKKRADHCQAYNYAETLYNAGYRKLPENAVVTTREMYDELYKKANLYEYQKENAVVLTKEEHKQWLKDCIESNEKAKEIARKETAREILEYLYNQRNDIGQLIVTEWSLYKLTKQYGVEVEENDKSK